jgi:hypothetical protein
MKNYNEMTVFELINKVDPFGKISTIAEDHVIADLLQVVIIAALPHPEDEQITEKCIETINGLIDSLKEITELDIDLDEFEDEFRGWINKRVAEIFSSLFIDTDIHGSIEVFEKVRDMAVNGRGLNGQVDEEYVYLRHVGYFLHRVLAIAE